MCGLKAGQIYIQLYKTAKEVYSLMAVQDSILQKDKKLLAINNYQNCLKLQRRTKHEN